MARNLLRSQRTTTRRALVAVAGGALCVLALATVPAGAASVGTARSHAMAQHDSHGNSNGNSPRFRNTNMTDHGGPVLAASHVYVIWWGASSAWASDVQPGIVTLFQGFNGSSYANTATQYMRGAPLSIGYSGQATDSSTPPSSPSPSTLATEASRLFPTADPAGIYVVYTSNFPSGGNYCAWHSYGTVDGITDPVAYMPNTSGISGCDPGNLYNVSGSEGLRSLANVSAHELMESVTDPLISAWYDSSQSEIGDKCAWKFASAVSIGGRMWQLQEEWSNAMSGCAQTS